MKKMVASIMIAVFSILAGSAVAFAGYEAGKFVADQSEYEEEVKTAGNYYYLAAASTQYNCLAYALGDTSQWIWPWGNGGSYPTYSQADSYMSTQNYSAYAYSQTVSNVKIIAYANSSGMIKHFSKVAGNNYINAKWGQLERLQSLSWDPYTASGTYGSAARKYK